MSRRESSHISTDAYYDVLQSVVQDAPPTTSKRLLIVSSDVTFLEEGSIARKRVEDLSGGFGEVHVVVLNRVVRGRHEAVQRLASNIWMYPTDSTTRWQMVFDAYRTITSQLFFSGSFTADIVVAEDPFAAGLVGWYVSQKYGCPFQLHVTEDFFDNDYIATMAYPVLYAWVVEHLLNRVMSVRTRTESQRQAVIAEYPRLASSTLMLPQYDDWVTATADTPQFSLRERYPQFRYILLHISSMNTHARTEALLLALAKVLRAHPYTGLVIVGSGPLRSHLEDLVITHGLEKQIEFEAMPQDLGSHLKTADVLVHSSLDADTVLIQAALAKLPIITHASPFASQLFVHGGSAYLCTSLDCAPIAEKIAVFLSTEQAHNHFTYNARRAANQWVERTYQSYRQAYIESIQRCLSESS